MKTFTQYLKESPLPKDVDLGDVRGSDYIESSGLPKLTVTEKKFWTDYINKLDQWLEGGSAQSIGKYLIKNRAKIPAKHRQASRVYRGMGIDIPKDLLAVFKKGVIAPRKELESWTKDIKVAQRFAKNAFLDGGSQITFVLSANAPAKAVVLDIESFVLDRKTARIGAAVDKDYFTQMDYVKGSGSESEILVDTKSLGAVPFDAAHVTRIKWYHKELAWHELELGVKYSLTPTVKTIKDWMKKYKEKDFDNWLTLVTKGLDFPYPKELED